MKSSYFALCALAAAIAGLSFACQASSSSSDVPPLTGLIIDANGLFGAAGCGAADHQLAHYGVTVHAAVDDPNALSESIVASGAFECFADASFLELPVDAGPSATFTLRVYGLNRTSYLAHADAMAQALASRSADGEAQLSALAQFEAECKAVQRAELRTTATCRVLRDDRAGETDAGDAGDNDAGETDAGDAGDNDAGETDAGDAGDNDAGETDAGDAGNTDAGDNDAGDAGDNDAGDTDAGDAGETDAGDNDAGED